MKESSKELLAGLKAHPDVVVEVTTGVEHCPKGRVTPVVGWGFGVWGHVLGAALRRRMAVLPSGVGQGRCRR